MNETGNLELLLRIMERLRSPLGGCPWDLQQTFASIAPHTLEEAYEVVDAIETGDMPQLQQEVGDLLFQVVFYAQLGREQQLFDFNAIAAAISTKLLQRHPHVFPGGVLGDAAAVTLSADQVVGNWEAIKVQERRLKSGGPGSALDDIPLALPALLRAAKLQKRAAGTGFDWPGTDGVLAKIREELQELEEALAAGSAWGAEEELGDLLFTLVNLARHLHLDPETVLRRANSKFELRFRGMEQLARAQQKELGQLDDAALDALWEQAKAAEKSGQNR